MKEFLFIPEEQVLWEIEIYKTFYGLSGINEVIGVLDIKKAFYSQELKKSLLLKSIYLRHYNILLKHCK